MSSWFTTWAFWAGAIWGFAIGVLLIFHSLVKPMARLLGFEKARPEREG